MHRRAESEGLFHPGGLYEHDAGTRTKGRGEEEVAFSAGMIEVNTDRFGLIPIPRVGGIERDGTGRNNVDSSLVMRERRNWTITANTIIAAEVSIQAMIGIR